MMVAQTTKEIPYLCGNAVQDFKSVVQAVSLVDFEQILSFRIVFKPLHRRTVHLIRPNDMDLFDHVTRFVVIKKVLNKIQAPEGVYPEDLR